MMRSVVLLLALSFALFGAVQSTGAAQIYTWKDKEGQTHYSDTPPSTGEVKTLRGAPPVQHLPVTDEDADENDAAAVEADGTAEAAARLSREEQQEADRSRFCSQAQNQLNALKSGQRIARMNAAGEREFLSDAERAEETARLERQISEHCN